MSTLKSPDKTRNQILAAAFQVMTTFGFRGASLDDILARTTLTKGAFYHHFAHKNAAGYAVVDTLIRDYIATRYLQFSEVEANALDALRTSIATGISKLTKKEILSGCPLANLSSEMASLDEGFRTRLSAVYDMWIDGYTGVLQLAREQGALRIDVDVREFATDLVIIITGARNLAKITRSRKPLAAAVRTIETLMDNYSRRL